MNRETLKDIVDATVKGDDERLSESVKAVMLEKVRTKLGYEKPVTEAGNVRIQNNDVFVSGKRVGSVNIDDESPVVEFTDVEGEKKEFDDIEEFHRHLANVFEAAPEAAEKVKKKALEKGKKKTNAGDGEEGEYTSHELKSKHKDDRMENPKGHDHGHDDKSGLASSADKDAPASGTNYKDDRMENPKKHDHGHDSATKDA